MDCCCVHYHTKHKQFLLVIYVAMSQWYDVLYEKHFLAVKWWRKRQEKNVYIFHPNFPYGPPLNTHSQFLHKYKRKQIKEYKSVPIVVLYCLFLYVYVETYFVFMWLSISTSPSLSGGKRKKKTSTTYYIYLRTA